VNIIVSGIILAGQTISSLESHIREIANSQDPDDCETFGMYNELTSIVEEEMAMLLFILSMGNPAN
jgi:hypothetical protein